MAEIYTPHRQIADPPVSPDGKQVAFIEGLMSDEGSVGGEILTVPVGGGTVHNLTPKISSSPSALVWTSPDRILFGENVDGKSGFASVSTSGGAVQKIWAGDESVSSQFSLNGALSRGGWGSTVNRQAPNTPADLWAGPIGNWKQLTTLNAGVKPAWGEMVNFHWTN